MNNSAHRLAFVLLCIPTLILAKVPQRLLEQQRQTLRDQQNNANRLESLRAESDSAAHETIKRIINKIPLETLVPPGFEALGTMLIEGLKVKDGLNAYREGVRSGDFSSFKEFLGKKAVETLGAAKDMLEKETGSTLARIAGVVTGVITDADVWDGAIDLKKVNQMKAEFDSANEERQKLDVRSALIDREIKKQVALDHLPPSKANDSYQLPKKRSGDFSDLDNAILLDRWLDLGDRAFDKTGGHNQEAEDKFYTVFPELAMCAKCRQAATVGSPASEVDESFNGPLEIRFDPSMSRSEQEAWQRNQDKIRREIPNPSTPQNYFCKSGPCTLEQWIAGENQLRADNWKRWQDAFQGIAQIANVVAPPPPLVPPGVQAALDAWVKRLAQEQALMFQALHAAANSPSCNLVCSNGSCEPRDPSGCDSAWAGFRGARDSFLNSKPTVPSPSLTAAASNSSTQQSSPGTKGSPGTPAANNSPLGSGTGAAAVNRPSSSLGTQSVTANSSKGSSAQQSPQRMSQYPVPPKSPSQGRTSDQPALKSLDAAKPLTAYKPLPVLQDTSPVSTFKTASVRTVRPVHAPTYSASPTVKMQPVPKVQPVHTPRYSTSPTEKMQPIPKLQPVHAPAYLASPAVKVEPIPRVQPVHAPTYSASPIVKVEQIPRVQPGPAPTYSAPRMQIPTVRYERPPMPIPMVKYEPPMRSVKMEPIPWVQPVQSVPVPTYSAPVYTAVPVYTPSGSAPAPHTAHVGAPLYTAVPVYTPSKSAPVAHTAAPAAHHK